MLNLFKKSPNVNSYPFIREIKSPVTKDQLIPLDEKCRVIQFSSPLTDTDHEKLSQFAKNYPTVSFRVYGHYGKGRLHDLNFLRHYPFVKNFQVDVFEIASIDGIEYLPENLEYFGFGQTRKKFSLNFLEKFKNLHELYIEGHDKDIEIISKLVTLERLTFRSITLKDLSILLPLKKLWWLAIKLGGTRNLSLLPKIGGLKYLELWMVRGLEDISSISELKNLQFLFLQDLKNVKELPDLSECRSLKRIAIENLKGLSDLSPLLKATNLEELIVVSGNNFQPNDFIPLKNHQSLKSVLIGLGSTKKNDKVEEILGLPKADYSKFDFKFE
jgi:hypothetical protein